MAKTIETRATREYNKVIETRKAKKEEKQFIKEGINYKAVNIAVVEILSLFGEDFKGEVIDLVVISLKNGKWTVSCQNFKGTITEKTRARKIVKERIKKLNELNITNREREIIEEAVAKYCNILVSNQKSLILQLNMDIED